MEVRVIQRRWEVFLGIMFICAYTHIYNNDNNDVDYHYYDYYYHYYKYYCWYDC